MGFLMPPYMSGDTGVQQWDRSRYKPADKNRDIAYYECLNATAGQGREPFDACMAGKGYTR